MVGSLKGYFTWMVTVCETSSTLPFLGSKLKSGSQHQSVARPRRPSAGSRRRIPQTTDCHVSVSTWLWPLVICAAGAGFTWSLTSCETSSSLHLCSIKPSASESTAISDSTSAYLLPVLTWGIVHVWLNVSAAAWLSLLAMEGTIIFWSGTEPVRQHLPEGRARRTSCCVQTWYTLRIPYTPDYTSVSSLGLMSLTV
ncbi:hypothetical protein GE09DRAFT_604086 [Coniochaeta sp. 2T2.1]|nr:hypothetical protein GE09DRAFT_604086 [Coniochaeta sp. 2T2.1]